MENPFRECSGCQECFPIELMKKGEFYVSEKEAVEEKLKIVEVLDNPNSGLVLVEDFFCIPCYDWVCGESENP